MQRIFGILYLDDKRTDIDKKGNHLKKFKSFVNYDEFTVKTKKTEMHRTYCIINTNDKSINEYISQNNINDLLFTKMALCNWTMRLQNINQELLKKYIIDKTSLYRETYDNVEILSVDPDNCIDIDDAISVKINNNIEIGIHIADPSSYINVDSEIGREFFNRCESIYFDKTYHMIPEILGLTNISLLKNKISRAFSLIINFDCIDINDIKSCILEKKYTYKFIKTNINVSQNLSYNEFEQQLNINNNYKLIYNIGKQILCGLNIDLDDYDSHKMIESYMLLCNNLAANHTSIKRINTIKKNKTEIKHKLYKNCLQNAAKYDYSDEIHEGLGLKYTHFTSPMRRYVDFINHIIIYNNIYEKSQINPHIDLDHINNMHAYYKKIYNLRNIYNLLGDNDNINIHAQIIFIEDNILRVIICDNKLFNSMILNINIFNNKIIKNNLINIQEKTENNIIFTYKEKIIKFELFQYININIFRTPLEIIPYKFIIDELYDLFY